MTFGAPWRLGLMTASALPKSTQIYQGIASSNQL